MNEQQGSELKNILTALINQNQMLLSALGHEKEAIKSNNSDTLKALIEEKTAHVSAIDNLTQQMQQQVPHSNSGQQIINSFQTLSQPLRNELTALWEQLATSSNDCQKQNAVNGQALAMHVTHARRVRRILQGADQQAEVYDKNGQV